jgi:hypothetical protein
LPLVYINCDLTHQECTRFRVYDPSEGTDLLANQTLNTLAVERMSFEVLMVPDTRILVLQVMTSCCFVCPCISENIRPPFLPQATFKLDGKTDAVCFPETY